MLTLISNKSWRLCRLVLIDKNFSSDVQLELQIPLPYSLLLPLKPTLQPAMSLRRSGTSQEWLIAEVVVCFCVDIDKDVQVCWWSCVHICTYMCKSQRSTSVVILCLLRQDLSHWWGTYWLSSSSQFVSPRNSPVFTSMVPESQVHNTTPDFVMWVLGIDLIFSWLHDKHFSNWAICPAPSVATYSLLESK